MDFSKTITCGHCNNISKMEIIGSIGDLIDEVDPENGHVMGQHGTYYDVLKCPACDKPNIVCYGWYDGIESEDEVNYEFLYPLDKSIPLGLPSNILSTYMAAEKVKTIDVNAYAILMRRILELICIDRKATRNTLALMLKDLADKNEIPDKLVKVANGLKNFGNIGAHAGIGELSKKEIPIVHALTKAILEYIYSAPYLATLAENMLKSIKPKK
jgi:hypothetical protein